MSTDSSFIKRKNVEKLEDVFEDEEEYILYDSESDTQIEEKKEDHMTTPVKLPPKEERPFNYVKVKKVKGTPRKESLDCWANTSKWTYHQLKTWKISVFEVTTESEYFGSEFESIKDQVLSEKAQSKIFPHVTNQNADDSLKNSGIEDDDEYEFRYQLKAVHNSGASHIHNPKDYVDLLVYSIFTMLGLKRKLHVDVKPTIEIEFLHWKLISIPDYGLKRIGGLVNLFFFLEESKKHDASRYQYSSDLHFPQIAGEMAAAALAAFSTQTFLHLPSIRVFCFRMHDFLPFFYRCEFPMKWLESVSKQKIPNEGIKISYMNPKWSILVPEHREKFYLMLEKIQHLLL